MRKVGVTFVAMGLMVAALCLPASAQLTVGVFGLKPNPPFLKCLQSAATVTPSATVVIKQNEANDDLTIVALGIKPNLAFDLFTVQNSNLLASGSVNPAFKNFGLAWYQTDLQADAFGRIGATIRSILINQIFGFDAGTTPPLPPTNTFHVGFWFNNPADANVPGKCVFDVTKPTPFNGEHKAGPLAMISTPNATTNLGPLCLNPNTTTHPATCNP